MAQRRTGQRHAGSTPIGQRHAGGRRVGQWRAGELHEPRFMAMIGLVAGVVALVIVVFFGLGYLFGRAFV